MGMIEIAVIGVGLVMIAAALLAVFTKSAVTAVIGSGVVSLMASLVYLFYGAPDVAMTEAAIGSGLMTTLFFMVLARIKRLNNG